MTHGIVDALEIVEVDGNNGKFLIMLNEVFHKLADSKSVRQACESVSDCLVTDVLLVAEYFLIGKINNYYGYQSKEIHEQSGEVGCYVTHEDVDDHHRELQEEQDERDNESGLAEQNREADYADV